MERPQQPSTDDPDRRLSTTASAAVVDYSHSTQSESGAQHRRYDPPVRQRRHEGRTPDVRPSSPRADGRDSERHASPVAPRALRHGGCYSGAANRRHRWRAARLFQRGSDLRTLVGFGPDPSHSGSPDCIAGQDGLRGRRPSYPLAGRPSGVGMLAGKPRGLLARSCAVQRPGVCDSNTRYGHRPAPRR